MSETVKLIIEIPKAEYERLVYIDNFKVRSYIENGTPLPKGHGRLIDADALVNKMEEREEKLKDDRSMWETAVVKTALDMFAPTIIEADKAESEVAE